MISNLFYPENIVVVGASRHKEKLGYQILDNLISSGFKGNIFPINPEAGEILGFKAYEKVEDVSCSHEIDLAIIIVPAVAVPNVLKNCITNKIPYAVIISSGFSEIGGNGKLLQKEIDEIISNSSIRVLGPNCLGIFNTHNNFNATFAAPVLKKGNVSAVFQSGALGVALLDWAGKFNFGFSKFVSLGNKIDLEESEIVSYLGNDPNTKVIAVYLEQISNPLKFLETCRRVSKEKPIVILKGGMTSMGSKAAFSHTASIVGSSEVTKALLTQANLIVARTIEEMLNLIQVLSFEPEINGDDIAIITNAGGPGILATDMADSLGLKMSKPSDKESDTLKENFSEIASLKNPFDLTGTAKAEDYRKILNYVLSERAKYSAGLVILTPQTATEVEETAKVLAERANARKPVIASFLGDKAVESGLDILREAKVPHFENPELAVYALWKILSYYKKRKEIDKIIHFEKNDFGKVNLSPLALLSHYGINIAKSINTNTESEVLKAVRQLDGLLAVKSSSPTVVHKYRAGKVFLNIQNGYMLKAALKKVGWPALIQEMVESNIEIFIGAKREENYGIVLSFGWGGTFVEELKDISTRIIPLTTSDLDEMIKETKIGKVLIKEEINLNMVKSAILAVAKIMIDFPEITEMDLNPLKVKHDKIICVDARYKIG